MVARIVFGVGDWSSCIDIERLGPALFRKAQRDDDDLTIMADLTRWLDGETISSVTRSSSGTTIAGTANTTKTVTQRLKGAGYTDIKVVTSGSQTKQFRILVQRRTEDTTQVQLDYPDD